MLVDTHGEISEMLDQIDFVWKGHPNLQRDRSEKVWVETKLFGNHTSRCFNGHLQAKVPLDGEVTADKKVGAEAQCWLVSKN